MSISTLIFINFTVILILLFLVITLLIRVRRLEEKSIDVSSKDISTYVEQMRDLIIESEQVAERLDISIKEREAVLEDLSDIVSKRIERLGSDSPLDTGMQQKVYKLLLQGQNEEEIARILGISVTEVNLLLNMVSR